MDLIWKPGTKATDWHGGWRKSDAQVRKEDEEYKAKHPELFKAKK